MKTLMTIVLAFLTWTGSVAQDLIDLPAYQQGKYEVDTFLTYYGSLPMTTYGSIAIQSPLVSEFITGVSYKMVIDSTNSGMSPTHSVYADGFGTSIAVYKGDTVPLPTNISVGFGEVGFHLIVEGTPQVAGESYKCKHGFFFTLGSQWDMIILNEAAGPFQYDTCTVGVATGTVEPGPDQSVTVFPNPMTERAVVKFEHTPGEIHDFKLIDVHGKIVREIRGIDTGSLLIERETLPPGIYLYQLTSRQQRHSVGKWIVR